MTSPQGNEPSAVEKAVERLINLTVKLNEGRPNAYNPAFITVGDSDALAHFFTTELQAMFEAGFDFGMDKKFQDDRAQKSYDRGHTTGYQMGVREAIDAIEKSKIPPQDDYWGINVPRAEIFNDGIDHASLALSTLLTTDRKEEPPVNTPRDTVNGVPTFPDSKETV